MIAEELAKLFPHGHPAFIPMCVAEMELYSAKSYEYTDGGDPMGNFKRVAGMLAPYTEVTPVGVALVYMSKQLDSAMWMLSQGYEGKLEGVDARLADVGVYAKLARILHSEVEL